MPSLPKYEDCEHSLFISYGFSDNQPYDWVGEIKTLINRHLRAKIPSFKTVFLSCKNTFSSGDINDELENKLRQSFAMLMVIDNGYADSKWCEEELKLFKGIFGEEGFVSRLFIVAKNRQALEKVKNGDNWKDCIDLSKLFYLEMWDEDDPNTPMRPRTKAGVYDPDFETYVTKITAKLKEKIDDSLSTNEPTSNQVGLSSSVLTIGIAPVVDSELESKSSELKKRLEGLELKCLLLEKDIFDEYDLTFPPSKVKVQKALQPLDALIVPFQNTKPLVPGIMEGGHLGILEKEWAEMGKSRAIIWYRPFNKPPSEGEVAPKHLNKIASLKPFFETENDVCELFSNATSASIEGIRIRIQNPKNLAVYEPLKEKFQDIWGEIIHNNPLQLQLICHPLDMNHLELQKDSNGYVVVNPAPLKAANSVDAQITLVEKAVAKENGNSVAGRIALIFFPGVITSTPEMRWPIINCQRVGDDVVPDDITLKPDDELEMKQFLKALLRKHTKK